MQAHSYVLTFLLAFIFTGLRNTDYCSSELEAVGISAALSAVLNEFQTRQFVIDDVICNRDC